MDFANLHIHSVFSDGLTGTAALAREIYSIPDLRCFSLTDHDTLSGIEPMFRAKRRLEAISGYPGKKFIPGIELSLVEPETSMTVHLLGYFPWLTDENLPDALPGINRTLGPYCVERTLRRGIRDLDERVRCAWEINLDGLADRWESADSVIRVLREKDSERADEIFAAEEKTRDIIKHPIPTTYQILIDNWEMLCPGYSSSHIYCYILRRDHLRVETLASLYQASGMSQADAAALADERQGILNRCLKPPSGDLTILDGLSLLKETGAVTVLAHPAAEHSRFDYRTVDKLVLEPLVEAGLDGIETAYPYDRAYRAEAIEHYRGQARRFGLTVSGGTDFHGDGRTGLRDVEQDCREAGLLFSSSPTPRRLPCPGSVHQ